LKRYSEGLICLSACLAGALPRLLLRNDYEGAKNYALKLKGIFSPGDFYIELQDHGIPEEKAVNPLLAKLASEIDVKCVATNDVHYIKKSDAEMHDVLLCIQTASYFDDPDRMKFPTDEFYLKSRREMEKALGAYKEALDTPFEIADKCDVSFSFHQYSIPDYSPWCPENKTPADFLKSLAYDGIKKRYGEITPALKERAEDELEVIISMGFADYYLIVWDFIYYAKTHGIPVGPGRGSGVGSLVAYAIGITDVDPIKYNLIFERFLNRSRTSMPDFDIDFCYNKRSKVIDYVKEKYGENRISQIITFGTMKKRAAIKDVARVFRIPFSDVTKMTKNIGFYGENDKKVHISDLVNPESPYAVPELIESYKNNPDYKKVIDIAVQLEGMPRNASLHAAGVVIYKNPAIDTVPLALNGNEISTQFDMTEIEKLGLLKMDFLALMTLTDLDMAREYAKKRTGEDVDFDKLGYEDRGVYDLIGSGDTDAVFQLEGGGMKRFMRDFRPTDLEEIIAGIALYRPGPMANIGTFLANKKNPSDIVYKHPLLENILRVTYGIIVYQEQAMEVTRALAGYDMTRADKFRALISKKKMSEIPAERNVFINGLEKDGEVIIPGCVRNGISAEVAGKIFDEMESFASYAFNKSHAAAYAFLSYQTAYYKKYFPVEYMAAVLNNRIGKPDDTAKYMQILKLLKIRLYPPDVNKSNSLFSPEGEGIRYGLSCIKNVGAGTIESLISDRKKNGPFKDLYDFIERALNYNVNKRMLESMIKGGAFDSFGLNRASLMGNYEPIMADAERKKKNVDSDQFDLFGLMAEPEIEKYKYYILKEFPAREKLKMEKEMLGMYLTGHPLTGYEKDFEAFNFNTSMMPKKRDEEEEEEGVESAEPASALCDGMDVTSGGILSDVTIKRTKDGKEMAILVLEDVYDSVEIVAFSRVLATCKQYLLKDSLVKIKARVGLRDGEYKLTLTDIKPWDLAEKAEEPPEKRTLYINIKEVSALEKIDAILKAHPGKNK